MTIKQLCSECGHDEHTEILTSQTYNKNSQSITVNDILTHKCLNCGSLSFPLSSMLYIEKQLQKPT